jgi:DNA-binding transcriptional LysR family regulator
VRVEGQLVLNSTVQVLNAALAGFGLAYAGEDPAQPHLAQGRLERVLDDWCSPFSGTSPLLFEAPSLLTSIRLAG